MLNQKVKDFPYGPVVKMSPSNADDAGLIPGWGIKMSQVLWAKKKKKKKQYCNKFDKDFYKKQNAFKKHIYGSLKINCIF